MKDWMAIHTFLSEEAKAQHLSAKGKVKTEKEWAEYAMSLEKAKCVQEWCGHEEFFFCHWRAETEDDILQTLDELGMNELMSTVCYEMPRFTSALRNSENPRWYLTE